MHPQSNNPSPTDLLHTLVLAIADAADLHSAIDSIIKEVCLYTGWEYGESWVVEPSSGEEKSKLLYFNNWYTEPGAATFGKQRRKSAPDEHDEFFEKAWSLRSNIHAVPLVEEYKMLHWAEAEASGLVNVIAVPLISDDRRIVMVAFFSSKLQGDDSKAISLLMHDGSFLGELITHIRGEANSGDYRADVERRRGDEARQAQAVAEEANKAKSEFLSRMSHELRTPLNSIIGFADLLSMESFDPRQRENLGYIRQAGHHLLQLVNEVLDITSIETGAISFSLEPVHLMELITETIDLVRPQATTHSVKLEVETSQRDIYLKADRQRMKQVLLNLMSNAIKYNVENGSVVLKANVSATNRVRIETADTGIGIAPELISKLYMPFERLGVERLGAEGTGLGLALAKRLVEAMNGIIGVESVPGKGSVFWVEMPTTQMPTISTRDLVTVPISGLDIPEQTATILYVEDNLSNIRLVERILEHRQGIKLISCMQGRMALEISRDHQPDIILLDIHLPDMTGQAVLELIKADPVTRPIPVVIISADASAGTLERLMDAGAHGYLTKPIEVRRFLRMLDNTLSSN
ncbi:MAG: ATP-binding protein [Chloroflexia bacterium]